MEKMKRVLLLSFVSGEKAVICKVGRGYGFPFQHKRWNQISPPGAAEAIYRAEHTVEHIRPAFNNRHTRGSSDPGFIICC